MNTKTTKAAAEVHGDAATTTAEPTKSANKPARSGKAGKSGKGSGKAPRTRQRPAVGDTKAKAERKPRTDTKQAKLIAMLQAKDGATVEQIAAAFGWQPHTVRGALYGALKKKLGLDVQSEKIEGRGRVYRIGN